MRTSALALTAVAFLLAGCGGSGGNGSAPTGEETTLSTQPSTRVIPIAIKDGKPIGGITRVAVTNGQLIDLVVHSDVADEVHVHGYDLHQDVKAGGTAQIEFRATITGVFEAELESRGLQILELTVK